jgi:hypothetical protein
VAFAFGAPAPAYAVVDLGITQSASAARVGTGKTVTYTAIVTNHGTESVSNAYPSLFPNKPGTVLDAENPYQSAVPSQGVCGFGISEPFGGHNAVCDLGPLAPGESASVVAVARINEAADHNARLARSCESLAPPSCRYDYQDGNVSNDWVEVSTSIVTGSKKISIQGLPEGCATDDFTVTAKARGKGVNRVTAELRGGGIRERLAQSKGKRVSATVEVAGLRSGENYVITVKANLEAGKTLKATASFERC